MSFVHEPFTFMGIRIDIDDNGNYLYTVVCDSCNTDLGIDYGSCEVGWYTIVLFTHLVNSHGLKKPDPTIVIKTKELKDKIKDLQAQVRELESELPDAYRE